MLRIFAVCVLMDIVGIIINSFIISVILISISSLLLLFTLYFFRDPERITSIQNSNEIFSPADGKVVLIDKIKLSDNNFFRSDEELIQISIFLSPLNVHINRIPISGVIKHFKYIKGDYIVAFDDKASDRNERSEIGIEDKNGKRVLFKQIAGFVARRIVCDLKVGDEFIAGEKFGMIKFGSRMDIIFSKDSKVVVNIDDKVKAGESLLAKFI